MDDGLIKVIIALSMLLLIASSVQPRVIREGAECRSAEPAANAATLVDVERRISGIETKLKEIGVESIQARMDSMQQSADICTEALAAASGPSVEDVEAEMNDDDF
tara:strand:+ start:25120 stop:25437 length:318 start_codon:yes stop_codon:yes gene_type:complete